AVGIPHLDRAVRFIVRTRHDDPAVGPDPGVAVTDRNREGGPVVRREAGVPAPQKVIERAVRFRKGNVHGFLWRSRDDKSPPRARLSREFSYAECSAARSTRPS